MSDIQRRSISDDLKDAFLYAPLGLLGRLELKGPSWLAERQASLRRQLPLARALGELAIRETRKRALVVVARVSSSASTDRVHVTVLEPEGTESAQGPEITAPLATTRFPADPPSRAVFESTVGNLVGDELAIKDYDTLAASQIVARLDTLNPKELARIAAYERGTRHRRTILNRISQIEG